ncbi:hypothetical protein ATO6_24060 [Oceanicola sp. 22II-s10i]|nr:hypothetical protein ATO6_24060 [Oceanicola sp. 22II-s10i]
MLRLGIAIQPASYAFNEREPDADSGHWIDLDKGKIVQVDLGNVIQMVDMQPKVYSGKAIDTHRRAIGTNSICGPRFERILFSRHCTDAGTANIGLLGVPIINPFGWIGLDRDINGRVPDIQRIRVGIHKNRHRHVISRNEGLDDFPTVKV